MNRLLTGLVAAVLIACLSSACAPQERKSVPPPQLTLDQIADAYVKLVLALGEYDPNYVDAYYGPPEWRVQAKKNKAQQTILAIRNVRARLSIDLPNAPSDPSIPPELLELRKRYLRNQLGALEARALQLGGWKPGFDDESLALFDISAPYYGREDFQPMLDKLDQLLPKGAGSVSDRYNRYLERYAIPRDKLEAVMRAAIGSARDHTLRYFKLPEGEKFELAFVSGKPWSAYNWYQGNYTSRIEVNTDQPISISRAIQLASHEGYPGHHVYNVLLEDNLVRVRKFREFTVYPLFSPQSFIAEGAADYGVQMAFPPPERLALERQLFALAGFDPAEVETYDAIVEAAKPAGGATIEAARRYRDGSANPDETLDWLRTYALATPERAAQRIKFFDTYGSYIINYAYGEEVVKGYIERTSASPQPDLDQWRALLELLSTPRTPGMLKPEEVEQREAQPSNVEADPNAVVPQVVMPTGPANPVFEPEGN